MSNTSNWSNTTNGLNTTLYTNLYQYGYELACKNQDWYMMADMIRKGCIDDMTQYKMLCKYGT